MKQKLLSAALVLALMLSLAPAAVAVGDAETILSTGGNITLSENLTLTGNVTITKNTVLDLNGHTITGYAINSKSVAVGTMYDSPSLVISEGVVFSIKNGTLASVGIENHGTIKQIVDMRMDCPKTSSVIANFFVIDLIKRCTIEGNAITVINYGDIGLIDNCEITGHLTTTVGNSSSVSQLDADGKNSIGHISNCRLINDDPLRGSAFSGGEQKNAPSVIENSVLIGNGRGGITTYGGHIEAHECVIVNKSTEWGVSKTTAVWLAGDDGLPTPPHLEDCTLIAAEGPCGYGVLETTTENEMISDVNNQPVYGEVERTDWVYHEKADMSNCTFIPLSQAGSISQYTDWLMESAPAASNSAASLENFTPTNTYIQGQFTDVPETHWCSANVEKSYELGLMKGRSDTGFDPDGNVSLAQAITIAARLNSIYTTGTEAFTQGSVWYQSYVDYAKQNGIPADFTDYNATATRAEFAAILAAALPTEALEAINMVTDGIIPDVDMKDVDAQAIYMLYRAGILTGNDSVGTFTPNSSITRAAAAAIITRMADTSLRKSIAPHNDS